MTESLTQTLTQTHRVVILLAAVLAGLSAGVFFAFSTFVTPALDRLAPTASVTAMQSINRLAPNPPFMAALFAPVLLGGFLVATGLRRPGGALLVAATLCALAGVVVTVVYHVPHNDTLAAAGADDASGAAAAWRDFYPGWQAWNHVRTIAFTASTTLFALALRAAD